MTPQLAMSLLTRMVAADEDPTLTQDELTTLLEVSQVIDAAGNQPRALTTVDEWAASTTYLAGDVIRTGQTPERYFVAAVSGRSDTVEPSWPDLSGWPVTESTVTETAVVWQDLGGTYKQTWDLQRAAAEGWRWKAGKVANRYSFTTDSQTFNRKELIANCLEMASRYQKRSIGSIRVVRA